MPLAQGTRLGPYEIVAPLGEGAMGEVYRARDTRLARDVAIKILPASFVRDPDRLARFKREALALASLNHPHIATVYGLEDAGGEPALAMELVEGPSLAERIATAPLPVDEALVLARQIAEGLEAAHLRGIIHRDLKPHNIKLTRGGSVKLLDFGLAKLTERGGSSAAGRPDALMDSPTVTSSAMTAVGTLLGTAAYMAPEQARAQTVDHRADIWAFGCVLFEMLTGTRAFAGSGTTDVLAAILKGEPDWSLLPADTPTPVRRLLRRCLQKPLDRRLDSARDAMLEIDDARNPSPHESARGSSPRRWVTILPWVVAGACLAALVLNLTRQQIPVATGLSKLTIALSEPLVDTGRPSLALSPDGSRVAYVAQHGDSTAVYTRTVDGFETTAIPGTEGATSLLFSPDGEWIAFHAARRLRKVSVRGGPPVSLAGMADFMGASWSTNGSIIASQATSDLVSVPENGGEPASLLTSADRTGAQISRLLPHVLPGGRAILFNVVKPHEPQGSVAVRVLDSGEERILVPDATHPSYVDGWLIFARSGTLFAVRFDLQRLAVAGVPVPVLQGLMFGQAFGTTEYSVSTTGRLAYVTGAAAVGRRLSTIDLKGTTSTLSELRRAYYMPRVGPDGARLALTILEEGAYSLWMTESLSGRPSRIVENSLAPVWSPDGKSIAFTTARDGGLNLAVMRLDGSAPPKTILVDGTQKVPTSWTPDGKSIVFTRVDPGGTNGEDIYVIGADGTGARPLLQSRENESPGIVSPDGKWLAFAIGNMMTGGVAVAPLADPGRQSRVDAQAATMPVWSRNGRELFFLAGPRRNRMMAVTITDDDGGPRLDKPRLLFEHNMGTGIGFSLPRYDVMPDGQRFVFATAEDAAPATEIRLILDWAWQLRSLMPRKN
jgi:serine/threonine protein kinase/Tol biopolymer transport system component